MIKALCDKNVTAVRRRVKFDTDLVVSLRSDGNNTNNWKSQKERGGHQDWYDEHDLARVW